MRRSPLHEVVAAVLQPHAPVAVVPAALRRRRHELDILNGAEHGAPVLFVVGFEHARLGRKEADAPR